MNIVLSAVLRSEFRYFVRKAFYTLHPGAKYQPNWHIDAIAHQLMRLNDGQIHRLLINQPPRSLKSICVSVAYVAWILGHDPTRRVIVVSYSNDFAAELHRQFRMIIDAPWYRGLFPAMRIAKDTGVELVTTAGGSRYATSVGGTLTGRGADLIVLDDPLKAEEAMSAQARKRVADFYGQTLVSRLNDKATGAIVAVMQRLHEDDLSGHLIQQGNWQRLDLPAIAIDRDVVNIGRGREIIRQPGDVLHPERESAQTLEKIRAEMGTLKFSAQYQQRPMPIEGNLVKRAWFPRYDAVLPPDASRRIVQSWDTATMIGEANDYSVCTTWHVHRRDYYLVGVFRAKLEYPNLRRKVAFLAEQYSADTVLIEDAGPGMQLLQDLKQNTPNGMPRPIGIRPEGSKADRMNTQSSKIEGGQVRLPIEAPWVETFLGEVLTFPIGKHDDQVDSLSQFLFWAARQAFLSQHGNIGVAYQSLRDLMDEDDDGDMPFHIRRHGYR